MLVDSVTSNDWIDVLKGAAPILAALVVVVGGLPFHFWLAKMRAEHEHRLATASALYDKRMEYYETLLTYWWNNLAEVVIDNYVHKYNSLYPNNTIGTKDVEKMLTEEQVWFLKTLLVTSDEALMDNTRADCGVPCGVAPHH